MREQVINDGDGIDYSDHFTTTLFFALSIQAFNWAYEIGLRLGFGIKRASNKRVGRNTNLRQDYFVCRMGGKGPVNKDADSLMRGNMATAWCKCKFSMKVVELEENKWQLFDDEELAYIDAQVRAHVRPAIISAGLHQRNPEKSRLNRRQIYNHSQKVRAEERDGRNPAQQMLALAVQHKYIHYWVTDQETDELTHVFMAHPEAVKMFRSYYYVVLIDSTYKTNLYRLPLVEMVGVTPDGKSFVIAYALVNHESEDGYLWVLRKLKALLNDVVQPNAIVTDCEAGLLNAIPIVFPDSSHLLCLWHIYSNVETKALDLTGQDSWAKHITWNLFQAVVEAETEDKFNVAWGNLNAISELREEFERGAKMTEDALMIDCGCVKATTLGLLCACSLHRIARNGSRVPVDVLHAFWRKLEYDGSEAMPACDDDRLEELFDEIRNADPSMRSSMYDALYSQIHPEEEDVNEPRVNENPRGRPSRGTRRDPSAVEHARVRVRVGRSTP
ncbi:protein FAR1-RELATED SEQUENCE 5-like [Silene latifolia]|uniref:protein FAR1-RELATED SEQUENCE 5-like n=1 Tax=Silene latifolia TaxID=37657 RepID=UPI003D76D4A0